MSSRRDAQRSARRARTRRVRALGLAVVLAAIVAALGWRSPSSSSSGAAPTRVRPKATLPAAVETGERRDALGEAGGAVPEGTTVFDGRVPAVANLDPALLRAVRRAAADAAATGVGLLVDGGWRSPAYQQQLLDEAVGRYGSAAEAARWVATPEASAHVSGDAVDVGPLRAAAWLSEHGAAYGLCQIYANEPWHYELRTDAADRGCPPMYADAAHDPRSRR